VFFGVLMERKIRASSVALIKLPPRKGKRKKKEEKKATSRIGLFVRQSARAHARTREENIREKKEGEGRERERRN